MKTRKNLHTKKNKALMQTVRTVITPLFMFLLLAVSVYSVPIGPTISVLGNTTKNATLGSLINSTVNGSTPGGFIFTTDLTATQQNTRWKGYVGNVTGTLTLDDALDNTIFQWTLTSISGEVYATRAGGSINWTGINCTWIADGFGNSTQAFESSNRTPEHLENQALSHTQTDDNISATFDLTNHSAMTVGAVTIGKDECFSLQTWTSDSAQVFTDSDNAVFTEVLLYDGAFNKSTGNLVYATFLYEDQTGYRADSTYDFQMILPENGASGYSSSTGYYFYVELS